MATKDNNNDSKESDTNPESKQEEPKQEEPKQEEPKSKPKSKSKPKPKNLKDIKDIEEPNNDNKVNKPSEAIKDIDDIEDQVNAKIFKSKTFKKFQAIAMSLGTVPVDWDFNKISESEANEIIKTFNAWVEAGQPIPVLNVDVSAKVQQVLSVYRRKIFGKEKIYYKIKGKDMPEGLVLVPAYRQIPDPQDPSSTIDDETSVTSWTKNYTIDYTASKAKDLMRRCVNESPEPRFYICIDTHKYALANPDENFMADFDKTAQKLTQGEIL